MTACDLHPTIQGMFCKLKIEENILISCNYLLYEIKILKTFGQQFLNFFSKVYKNVRADEIISLI